MVHGMKYLIISFFVFFLCLLNRTPTLFPAEDMKKSTTAHTKSKDICIDHPSVNIPARSLISFTKIKIELKATIMHFKMSDFKVIYLQHVF